MRKGKRAFERTTRLSRLSGGASSSVVPFCGAICGQARKRLSNKVYGFEILYAIDKDGQEAGPAPADG